MCNRYEQEGGVVTFHSCECEVCQQRKEELKETFIEWEMKFMSLYQQWEMGKKNERIS